MSSLPETLVVSKIYDTESSWIERLDAQTHPESRREAGRQIGGKIMSAHIYRNKDERWCGLLPGSFLLGWWPLLFSKE
jgi:hypothetical protein